MPESVAASSVLFAMGALLAVVGWRGRIGRLEFSLGGANPGEYTATSWRRAHRTIGNGLLGLGVVSVAAGLVALAIGGSDAALGPLVVVVSAVVGVGALVTAALGVHRLERADAVGRRVSGR